MRLFKNFNADMFKNSTELELNSKPLESIPVATIPIECPCLDILVIDHSSSMLATDIYPNRKEAAAIAADRFCETVMEQAPKTKVGLITFHTKATNRINPIQSITSDYDQMMSCLHGADSGGSTNMHDALQLAGSVIDRQWLKKAPRIILLTDGHSNGSDPVPVAQRLKAEGVQIDVIGIGGDPGEVNELELRNMASQIDGQTRYWFIKDAGNLTRTFKALSFRSFE